MKRLVSLLLVIASLFSVALADDYSSMTYNELKTELDKILLEIGKKNINTEKLLCDSDGLKLYITGDIQFENSSLWDKKILVIPFTAINESDKDLQIIIDKIGFNEWELDNTILYSLDSHKKMKGKIEVIDFLDDTDIVAIVQIKEIVLHYDIVDSNMNTVSSNCRTTLILE